MACAGCARHKISVAAQAAPAIDNLDAQSLEMPQHIVEIVCCRAARLRGIREVLLLPVDLSLAFRNEIASAIPGSVFNPDPCLQGRVPFVRAEEPFDHCT